MSQRGGPPSQRGGPPSGRSRTGTIGSTGPGAPSAVSGPSAASATRPSPFPPGTGRDPGIITSTKRQDDGFNKRLDLPPEAYMKKPVDARFTTRPGFNTSPTAKNIEVEVNQFRMRDFGNSSVFQHVISVTPIKELGMMGILRKLWNHPRVRNEMRRLLGPKADFIVWDGRNLAWTTAPLQEEIRLRIDLDEGSPNPRQGNIFNFSMKTTTKIDLSHIKAYLAGKASWDNAIHEGVNFLDHVLREVPSRRLLAIKRNFYNRAEPRKPIDAVVEVAVGAYASVRINMPGPKSIGLGINVDVANTAMFVGGKNLVILAKLFLEVSERMRIPNEQTLIGLLAPVRKAGGNGGSPWNKSDAFMVLKRLYKLKFTMQHLKDGADGKPIENTVKALAFKSEYGEVGFTARSYKFEYKGKMVSVEDYYRLRYNIRLRLPTLPLVEGRKKDTYFPMELCIISPMQRYPFKLNGDQTSSMIKIAVSRPPERKAKIMEKHAMLNWQADPYLREFGISLEPQFSKVPARVLKAPTIQYGAKKTFSPGTSGRWNIQGAKFYTENMRPLRYWGFVIVEGSGAIQVGEVERFAKTFIQVYRSHGGKVLNERPRIWDESRTNNPADAIERCHKNLLQDAKNDPGSPPDLLFVIFHYRNSNGYQRVKKAADCKFGVLTQCIQGSHVKKNNPQYHSNVAMKVNCKLGGATNRLPNPQGLDRSHWFKAPTMIIGADVSHSAVGIIGSPSVASFVVSIDDNGVRYAAAAETNGWNEEIITERNIRAFINRLMPAYVSRNAGRLPQHVIYFRDGVSEGQFAHVVERESKTIKDILGAKIPNIRMTTIVATKRHHIRMFPPRGPAGDKNGNALPGTIIEKEVTHPFQWDFYLCSHVAIQGTARPVHYHVIQDDIGWKPNELQQMIYEQCYTYARATTPVSIHPAIYYAHLVSNRARVHEHVAGSEGPRTGPKAVESSTIKTANMDDRELEAPDSSAWKEDEPTALLPLGGSNPDLACPRNKDFFLKTMWFI